MRYGKKAMGNEFGWRVKTRNWENTNNRWHYEYFRTEHEADIYVQQHADKEPKKQLNRY